MFTRRPSCHLPLQMPLALAFSFGCYAQEARGALVSYSSVDAGFEIVSSRVNPATGNTYHLISGVVSDSNLQGGLRWSEASAYAEFFRQPGSWASLVSINSAEEEDWICRQFLPDGNRHQLLWIGLSDKDSEGDFEWKGGDEFHYSHWAPNLPHDADGSEDYVYFANTDRFDPFQPLGSWNDYSDQRTFAGVLPFSAIIEVTPIPEPSTALLVLVSLAGLMRRRR